MEKGQHFGVGDSYETSYQKAPITLYQAMQTP